MATVADIRTDLAAAIEAITPAVRPDAVYRERPRGGSPEEQSDAGSYELRSFKIEAPSVGKPGGYQGPLPEVVKEFVVHMFYPADAPVNDWDELVDMAGDDLDHLAATLRKYTRNRTAISVVLGAARSIELKPTTVKGIYAQRLILPILYRRGAVTLLSNYEAGDVPNFTSTTTMEAATLAGEELGSVDGDPYQMVSGTATLLLVSGAGGFQPGDVPTYADEAAGLAATLYGDEAFYSTADTRLAHIVSSASRLLYDVGDVPTYASVAAIEAAETAGTIYGDKIGKIGSQLYQIQASGSAEELNVPTFKTVSRAAALLPQATSTAYFTVTGTCWVLPVVSNVEVVIGAGACNAKWIANPTTGASVDLCAVVDIASAAAESSLTITGTLADAMVITAGGAVVGQAAPILVHAGTIEFSCSGSNTGQTSVEVHYMPVESGATITSA